MFLMLACFVLFLFFFFNDTATTDIYTLSLHDALPISCGYMTVSGTYAPWSRPRAGSSPTGVCAPTSSRTRDRKSTRLNSSHTVISYAVFCLKKKKKTANQTGYTTLQHQHTRSTAHRSA